MSYKVKGTIHSVNPSEQINEKFTKRSFVIKYADNPEYPQLLMFELINKRVAQADDINIGDEVEVEFNLRGREWTNKNGEKKYFNTLNAWEIVKVAAATPELDPSWLTAS